jgi:hypothetical protein
MALLLAETLCVTEDEPCFLLVEVNLQSPGSRGWRRYQILTVVRSDTLATARINLGPAKAFAAPQFRIPGGVHDEATGKIEILHSVGELREVADYQREGLIRQPEVQPSDLAGGYHDELALRRLRRRKLSQFGPHHRVQRS